MCSWYLRKMATILVMEKKWKPREIGQRYQPCGVELVLTLPDVGVWWERTG